MCTVRDFPSHVWVSSCLNGTPYHIRDHVCQITTPGACKRKSSQTVQTTTLRYKDDIWVVWVCDGGIEGDDKTTDRAILWAWHAKEALLVVREGRGDINRFAFRERASVSFLCAKQGLPICSLFLFFSSSHRHLFKTLDAFRHAL